MYLDLQNYGRRLPDPPKPQKPDYPTLSAKQQKLLLWVIGVNVVLLLVAPIGGATLISGLFALWFG